MLSGAYYEKRAIIQMHCDTIAGFIVDSSADNDIKI